MAITNFLPRTRQLVDKIYNFLEKRPELYKKVLRLAQRHDNWMGYRKYGNKMICISYIDIDRIDEG